MPLLSELVLSGQQNTSLLGQILPQSSQQHQLQNQQAGSMLSQMLANSNQGGVNGANQQHQVQPQPTALSNSDIASILQLTGQFSSAATPATTTIADAANLLARRFMPAPGTQQIGADLFPQASHRGNYNNIIQQSLQRMVASNSLFPTQHYPQAASNTTLQQHQQIPMQQTQPSLLSNQLGMQSLASLLDGMSTRNNTHTPQQQHLQQSLQNLYRNTVTANTHSLVGHTATQNSRQPQSLQQQLLLVHFLQRQQQQQYGQNQNPR